MSKGVFHCISLPLCHRLLFSEILTVFFCRILQVSIYMKDGIMLNTPLGETMSPVAKQLSLHSSSFSTLES